MSFSFAAAFTAGVRTGVRPPPLPSPPSDLLATLVAGFAADDWFTLKSLRVRTELVRTTGRVHERERERDVDDQEHSWSRGGEEEKNSRARISQPK